MAAIAATAIGVPWAAAQKGGGSGGGGGQVQLGTTLDDFDAPGTQATSDGGELRRIISSVNCMFCHADYGLETPPYDTWVVSLMAQSARDPVFHAALTIANQDADLAGSWCMRCHIPANYYRGGADDAQIPFNDEEDMDGINCHMCHRAVDPLGTAIGYPGDPVDPDASILADLTADGNMPISVGNAQVIIDPDDTRRAQYDDVPANYHGVDEIGNPIRLITSPYHQDSAFCGTCHEVSNPVFQLDPSTGRGVLTAMGSEHPTHDVYDMVPEQRTYSEWLNSDFAKGGVVFEDGRFGGALPDDAAISSCQNCHMPPQVGGATRFYDAPPFFERDDVGAHSFAGGNTWVLDAIADEMGIDADYYGLTQERRDAANARTEQMLRDASDMELQIENGELRVRLLNQSGHSLPTGYPEGRRMWINVKFLDDSGSIVREDGGYDLQAATLDDTTTKVYEKLMGITQDVADSVNLPAGKSLHLVLNNEILKDNRIPPRGFTNAAFAAFGGAPVGATYADGQYWDDTFFDVPTGATSAVATLYFQTSSREYMEFLRDTNVTDSTGQTAYDLWEAHGKSAPVAMDTMTIAVQAEVLGDLDGDGFVNGADFGVLLAMWGKCKGCSGDLDGDGMVGGSDVGLLLSYWTG